MLRAVQMIEAWLAKFQREAKSLLGHLCEETIVSGTGAEESAMSNERPQPLK